MPQKKSETAERQEEYPQILNDLAELVRDSVKRAGLELRRATEIGFEAAEFVRAHWSGQTLYLPKGSRYTQVARDAEIYGRFNGKNHAELASIYGLTEMRIYQIVARMRRLNPRQAPMIRAPRKNRGPFTLP